MKIKVGCDPEIFVLGEDGKPISMHDKVPGTKSNPHKLRNGAVQADGTAMEFNIEAADTPDQFSKNIKSVLRQLKKFVPEKAKMAFVPTVIYDPKYFEELPNVAKELGCDPDFNAFSAAMNPRPNNRTTMRTASGHIHVGWTTGANIESRSHLWDCREVIKSLDTVFGPLRFVWDHDTLRANMYGRPGCFRPKPYGVEWRTLSNAWLNHPELWPWLFESIQVIIDNMEKGLSDQTYRELHQTITVDKEGMFRKEYRKKIIDAYTSAYGLPQMPIDSIAKRMDW